MDTTRVKRAIDVAFSSMKTAWLDEQGQAQTQIIPSVAGLGGLGDLSAMGLGRRQRKTRPYQVAWDDYSYLVGENVYRHTRPIEDLGFSRLSEGLFNRALIYAALGTSLNGRSTQTDLMVCLPVEITQNAELARATLRTLSGWLGGPHQFSIDGRSVATDIARIKAVSQPVCAYLDWGMNWQGEWIRDREALRKPVAVADIGFKTLDLFGIEGGEIAERYTAGRDLGMHRVARAISAHLRQTHQVEVSLHEADHLMRTYLKAGAVFHACAAGDVDLSAIVEQSIQELWSDASEFLSDHWGNGRQFYKIIFAGGGSAAYRGSILRHYPTAHIPSDPVASIAWGALKRANRVFKN